MYQAVCDCGTEEGAEGRFYVYQEGSGIRVICPGCGAPWSSGGGNSVGEEEGGSFTGISSGVHAGVSGVTEAMIERVGDGRTVVRQKFDRNVYHREYMRGYMRTYLPKWRAKRGE